MIGPWIAALPDPTTGPLNDGDLAEFTGALGIDPRQVRAHQWVDNGPGWAVLQLPTATDVLALETDLTRIPGSMIGAIGAHPPGSEHAFEMRTFAPGVGVVEDPVCGSMNASVAQWLFATGAVTTSYRVSPGSRLGRAGSVLLSIDNDGTVWVGGATATCVRGTVNL